MVSAISSFDPVAYYKQLKDNVPAPVVATTPSSSTDSGDTPDNATASTATNKNVKAPSVPSDLLQLSPDILSLLQGGGSSQGNSLIGSLLGGGGKSYSSSSLAGAYASLLYHDAQATQSVSTSNPIQNLINSYIKAIHNIAS